MLCLSGLPNGAVTEPSHKTSWTVTVRLFTVHKQGAKQFQQNVIFSVVGQFLPNTLSTVLSKIFTKTLVLSPKLSMAFRHKKNRGLVSFTKRNTTRSLLWMNQGSTNYCHSMIQCWVKLNRSPLTGTSAADVWLSASVCGSRVVTSSRSQCCKKKRTPHTHRGGREKGLEVEGTPPPKWQVRPAKTDMTVSIHNRQLNKDWILKCSKEHDDEIKTMNKLTSLLQKYIICFHIIVLMITQVGRHKIVFLHQESYH